MNAHAGARAPQEAVASCTSVAQTLSVGKEGAEKVTSGYSICERNRRALLEFFFRSSG